MASSAACFAMRTDRHTSASVMAFIPQQCREARRARPVETECVITDCWCEHLDSRVWQVLEASCRQLIVTPKMGVAVSGILMISPCIWYPNDFPLKLLSLYQFCHVLRASATSSRALLELRFVNSCHPSGEAIFGAERTAVRCSQHLVNTSIMPIYLWSVQKRGARSPSTTVIVHVKNDQRLATQKHTGFCSALTPPRALISHVFFLSTALYKLFERFFV